MLDYVQAWLLCDISGISITDDLTRGSLNFARRRHRLQASEGLTSPFIRSKSILNAIPIPILTPLPMSSAKPRTRGPMLDHPHPQLSTLPYSNHHSVSVHKSSPIGQALDSNFARKKFEELVKECAASERRKWLNQERLTESPVPQIQATKQPSSRPSNGKKPIVVSPAKQKYRKRSRNSKLLSAN
jgi:hypothetical protein